MLHRYFIKLSFDGTNYSGWQIQKNATNTIQQKINEGLSRLLNEKIDALGCCRTDAGVHAKELYAQFDSVRNDLCLKNSHDKWLYKFNSVLPVNISIDAIFPVSADSNARFDATARSYEYFIHKKRSPFLLNRSYYYYGDLDIDGMNKASTILKKYKDFTSFSKLHTQVKTNNCIISTAKWEENKEGDLVFKIRADRFLRGMVRLLVGTLLQVGKGKTSLHEFKQIIESKDCSNAAALAPACGLYLSKVEYPPKYFFTNAG